MLGTCLRSAWKDEPSLVNLIHPLLYWNNTGQNQPSVWRSMCLIFKDIELSRFTTALIGEPKGWSKSTDSTCISLSSDIETVLLCCTFMPHSKLRISFCDSSRTLAMAPAGECDQWHYLKLNNNLFHFRKFHNDQGLPFDTNRNTQTNIVMINIGR